jgi:cytochrome b pre-mRNA-processing protein 3
MLARLFGRQDAVMPWRPLYQSVVDAARAPAWYAVGRVPDTLDGRFDMLAALLALTLLRIEDEGEPGREPAARLAELFIADMDGHLRQEGVGDIVVGKRVGKMMAALGGRMSAYRVAQAPDGDWAAALDDSVRRLPDADAAARDWLTARMRATAAVLEKTPLATLAAGGFREVAA